MFEKVISNKAKQNLAILNKASILKNFYLAAGTGLALQIGHRVSLDLDFFTKKEFRPEILVAQFKKIGNFSLKSKDFGTLHGIFNQTRITFLYYPYSLIFPTKKILKIDVADWRDIACMKLDAVSSRGSKKDFVDLYFICQKIKLNNLLKFFKKKYQGVDYNLIHILKSLIYFEDAEKEPMPKMLKQVSWSEIKTFFTKEVKRIIKI